MRLGPLFILAGIVALAQHEHGLERADAWAIAYVFCTAAGLALWLRRYTVLRWLAASLPFWSLANAVGWSMFLALTLSIGSLAVLAVGPTLPGRRIRRDGEPLPHLVNGPVAAIQPAAYSGGRRNRGVGIAAWVAVGLTMLFASLASLAAFTASRAVTAALAIASAIIAGTLFFANWFADRVRLRIDEHGLHSRTLFQEQTIPWREVAGLTIRNVYLPAYGMRLAYFVVFSPSREFAFLSTMRGAEELKASIETALGLKWPEPEQG
jgi:hypothetical protein